ncbi:MAG: M14 family metallopeptidase [Cyclobacteriaceae bacterium]|nr:M14 family metallopeptidase [Cyclobacteriaceae bacterium]
MTLLLITSFISLPVTGQGFLTVYEKSNHLETSTYQEGIDFYKNLAGAYSEITIVEKGLTDSGYSLHIVIISKSGVFDIAKLKATGKAFLLVNNAIHPGEPDGVEASQMLARNLVEDKKLNALLDNTVVVIIPFYNIGGALNRNSTTRVNQVGPKEYGFRGNANNYDLNRDFIKADTKNARSFIQLFQELDPDVFIDTHVSNGADYQYVSTTIPTQVDKLGGSLSELMTKELLPFHFKYMKEAGSIMTPYVNVWGMKTPDQGYNRFIDLPRYSSGYTTLFHTLGFMSETHMLKSFEQRVEATYNYILGLLTFTNANASKIIELRTKTKESVKTQIEFPLTWELDKTKADTLIFKGYEVERPISELTGKTRLKYNRDKPYAKKIPYYSHYKPEITITKPDYYVVPKNQWKVIELLTLNGVMLEKVVAQKDIEAEIYHIIDYKTRNHAYEGHYPHYEVKISKTTKKVQLEVGDYLVPTNQWRNRYIIETLEPQAPDSYFNWNFFDTILQQKEGFSAYVFEDLALEILANNPAIKTAFEEKKEQDEVFSKDGYAQLLFIYNLSKYQEKAFLRYPIMRYTSYH